jgi:hypothetical protein
MWTDKHLRKLLSDGKIRGYRITFLSKRHERKKFLQKNGIQKYWMEMRLQELCANRSIIIIPEYQFLKNRKFRFDWAFPDLKIGIEYEGIFSERSRHTNKIGYSRDAEKYNAAANRGWKVFRYTAINYKSMVKDLDQCISNSL